MPNVHKNPSRKTCEEAIRRILITETLEQGKNIHFKNANDFMSYFEALYPPSPSLLKQVQRAIKSMDLPKDEDGFYIVNKTKTQLRHDNELSTILNRSAAEISSLDDCETLFLAVSSDYRDYLITLIKESLSLKDKYVTIQNTSDGLIFYTKNKELLESLLNSLIGD